MPSSSIFNPVEKVEHFCSLPEYYGLYKTQERFPRTGNSTAKVLSKEIHFDTNITIPNTEEKMGGGCTSLCLQL